MVVTRCSNNFGPYQFPEKVIPLFTTNLLDGTKVPLYGDGGNVRDWIHVEDHNRAVQLVLEQGTVGEVYNIGAHNEITNRELTYRLLELCGRDESFIQPVADRLGHDRRYSVHIDKITALGWKLQRAVRPVARRDGAVVRRQPLVVGAAEARHRGLSARPDHRCRRSAGHRSGDGLRGGR